MEHLRQLQLEEKKILQDFQQLCNNHGLIFYISAGTLLGSVRHGGFIPWDDDIDVIMPRKDFDQLSAIFADSPLKNYFFQTRNTDPGYPYFFAKLRKNGTHVEEPSLRETSMHKGIYIDIFPLDICPRSDWGGRLYFKWVEQLQCAVMANVNPGFSCGYTKKYMVALHKSLTLLPTYWIDRLWHMTRYVLKTFCRGTRLSTACASHGYPYETYDSGWFSSVVQMRFEDTFLPAPAGWHELLTNMYGNYMAPPPEEERQGHFE